MESLRWIILAGVVLCLALSLFWARGNPRYRWLLLAPMSVIVHVALFHASRVTGFPIPAVTLNYWSAAIHLHIVILVLAGLILFWRVDL
jgi:hypothetical protein